MSTHMSLPMAVNWVMMDIDGGPEAWTCLECQAQLLALFPWASWELQWRGCWSHLHEGLRFPAKAVLSGGGWDVGYNGDVTSLE